MLHPRLTDRQAEVLELFCSGQTRQQIAETDHVTLQSVYQHLSAIRKRLGNQSLEELCRQLAEATKPTPPTR